LRPASDNAQFMRPVIVNRFPTPDVEKSVVVGCPSHLTKHRNIIELYSWIASESQIFQTSILFETNKFHHGGPPCSRGPRAIAPVVPPLIRPCLWSKSTSAVAYPSLEVSYCNAINCKKILLSTNSSILT